MEDFIAHFISSIKSLNKSIYGHIGVLKKQLLRKLSIIQKEMENISSDNLVLLEMKV